jgi:hypothetical protein
VLTVTIDLVPGGFEPRRRTIATMRIANITDLADVSGYRIEALEGVNPLTGEPARCAICEVEGHDRRQTVWALLEKACHQIIRAKFEKF